MKKAHRFKAVLLAQVLLGVLIVVSVVIPSLDPRPNSPWDSMRGAAFGDPGEKIASPHADRGEGPLHRRNMESWFYTQRAFPMETVPPLARLHAWTKMRAQMDDLLVTSNRAGGNAALGPWRNIGPAPIDDGSSGRVSALAVDPKDPNVIYFGAAQGGVWKSTNAAGSWTPLTDTQPSLATGAIAIDPVDTRMVYVGTGEATFSALSYYGAGILRSTDGGATWTQLGAETFARNAISRLIVDPVSAGSADHTTIYASSTRGSSYFSRINGPTQGVFVSRDSGKTWTLLRLGSATDIALDPSSNRTLYAAFYSGGVYKSGDGGLTWTMLTEGLPASDFGRVSLAVAPSRPGTLFASYEDTSEDLSSLLLGIYRSTDYGATWLPTGLPTRSCQCFFENAIAVDPDDADTLYWGGITLHRSTNGGAGWSDITRGIHVDQHAYGFGPASGPPASGRTLYVGNDGGVWKSTDSGANWRGTNAGVAITQFIGLASHPTNPNIAYGGTQDNGTLGYNGSPIWRGILGCDGGHTLIDFLSTNTVYATTQSNGCSRIARSDLSGAFFFPKTNGIPIGRTGFPDDRALFYAPLEMSPADPATLYYASYRVYRSRDRGDRWEPVSPDLTRGTGTGALRQVVTTIGPGPRGVIYAGTGDGQIQATFDDGATWTNLTRPPLPGRFVTRVLVDPENELIAYATFSGFNNATPFSPGHVFRTTNGGVSWADISGNLPDVPVNTIVLDPRTPPNARVLYVGTDIGVFGSTDGGKRWFALNAGLPNVVVLDLNLNTTTDILRAATHGRSVFDLMNVSQLPVAARENRFPD
ncbi:MAG: hypothetical protein HY650_08190 [Acidobacteria bacterium]|nr:hypothetical protein [Acidobacteriota bacterium]